MRYPLLAGAAAVALLALGSPHFAAADASCQQTTPGYVSITDTSAPPNQCTANVFIGGTAIAFAGQGTGNFASSNTNNGGSSIATAVGTNNTAISNASNGGTAISLALGNNSTANAGPNGVSVGIAAAPHPAGEFGGSFNFSADEDGGSATAGSFSGDSSVSVAALGGTTFYGFGGFAPIAPSAHGATVSPQQQGAVMFCSSGVGVGFVINLTTGQFCIAH